jgi:hypothetical protein
VDGTALAPSAKDQQRALIPAFSSACCVLDPIMTKPIKVTPKKGRGKDPAEIINQMEAWAAANDAGRSEAIRRLVDIGLSKSAGRRKPPVLLTSKQGADRTAERLRKSSIVQRGDDDGR